MLSDILVMLFGYAGHDGSICWPGWILRYKFDYFVLAGWLAMSVMMDGWLCCLCSLAERGVYVGSMAVLAKVAAWLC
jgi:hypothetical protein